ncbi:MAG: hypothetical protein JRJ00_00055 [Deltaproteobacteria bacterium]|nr:hypothetical protein [Deltaproteobacteria bacterium]
MTFAESIKAKMKQRGITVPFVCKHIEISEYKLRRYMDEENPEPEFYIQMGILKAIDTIGLP